MKLCTDAKSFMRTYGGTEDYDSMILDAVPILPPAAAETPADTSRVRDALSTVPTGGQVPTAPPAVSSQTSDRLAAVEAIVEPGRLGDWMALARMARVLQREGRRGPFGAMAQSLLRMR